MRNKIVTCLPEYLDRYKRVIAECFVNGESLSSYMVKSGLVDRVDVSQYRLSLHLTLAFIILGLIFLFYGLNLYIKKTKQQAKKLMIFSIVYISLLQITYVFDKFI